MRKEIKVDTKTLIEIYCDINNAVLEEDKMPAISCIKHKIGIIINEGLHKDIFSGDIIPFKINFDMLSKILENGKI